jgi:hypothetical protein
MSFPTPADFSSNPPSYTAPLTVGEVVAIATAPLGASGTPSEATAVATRATSLFRAVEPAEFADIVAQGAFRNPLGIESKYFATTAEGAAREAQMLSRLGAGPFTIVETSIPNGVLRSLPAGNILAVDGGVSTVVLGSEHLPLLGAPQVMPFIPLP